LPHNSSLDDNCLRQVEPPLRWIVSRENVPLRRSRVRAM